MLEPLGNHSCMYTDNTLDRLKESAEIGKKAEDILLDVSKVVKELKTVQTVVLSRRPLYVRLCSIWLLKYAQLPKMEFFNGFLQLISPTSMRDSGKMCKRPTQTRGDGSLNLMDLRGGNSFRRASSGCMETVSDSQTHLGSSSLAY